MTFMQRRKSIASTKIIIDTDPGQDDAVAILLALASPELEVVGIVTVAGNVPLHRTTRNAQQIRELADRADVPIYAGAVRPMRRDLVTAEHVHGETGLDGVDLSDPKVPVSDIHGVDYLIDTFRRNPARSITLVTLGPVTNLAIALVKAPDIAEKIERLVMIMGTHLEGGNITPAASFNEYVDPEAADLVLRSGLPITMIPLDVMHKCLTKIGRAHV